MARQADVRRIALRFPGTVETEGRFAFSVPVKDKLKGYAWVWMERIHPKKPRVANPTVLAVRVASLYDKDLIISSAPAKFFTEPHYNGFPAVLVRLAEVTSAELEPLLEDAWRTLAPSELLDGPKTAAGKKTRVVAAAAKTKRKAQPTPRRKRPRS